MFFADVVTILRGRAKTLPVARIAAVPVAVFLRVIPDASLERVQREGEDGGSSFLQLGTVLEEFPDVLGDLIFSGVGEELGTNMGLDTPGGTSKIRPGTLKDTQS